MISFVVGSIRSISVRAGVDCVVAGSLQPAGQHVGLVSEQRVAQQPQARNGPGCAARNRRLAGRHRLVVPEYVRPGPLLIAIEGPGAGWDLCRQGRRMTTRSWLPSSPHSMCSRISK